MEIGAIGVPGTPALNLVDQAKGADQENVTTLPQLIMGMRVMDKEKSLKLAILTRAQVNGVQTSLTRINVELK